MGDRTAGATPVLVHRRDGARSAYEKDALVVEEPLEIRVREGVVGETRPLVVTMRTPGDDEDLCVGLLFGEGVISSPEEVLAVARLEDPRVAEELARNVVVATLSERPDGPRLAATRSTVMGSACGVCGRTSIEDVVKLLEAARRSGSASAEGAPLVSPEVLTRLPAVLRKHQNVFTATGGLHAAGLFEADGTLVLVREDVGRHNAADKAIGALLRTPRPAPPLMLVSGRIGFEIVQKAALAGVKLVAAVSAPTSLAVDLAEQAGLTLVGFLRGERFNTYTHSWRVGTGGDIP